MAEKIHIGALISGSGTNLQAIIDACESGRIDAEMAFVGSDTPSAYGLKRAADHHIDTFVVDYSAILRSYQTNPARAMLPDDFDFEDILAKQSFFPPGADAENVRRFLCSRAIAEAELLKQMQPFSFDLLVLAGFMRNLSPYFIDRINTTPDRPRIMNIHPALLPAFPGVDGYGDTFRYGCKVGGCTVHFIDYGEDSGPIIGQRSFSIEADDTLDSIKQKGLALEWALYPECIQHFARGHLKTVRKSYPAPHGKTVARTIVEIG